jgi:serine/threonine-protein kinase
MRCFRCHAEIESSFKACPHCGEAVTDFARRYATELLDNKYRIVERLGAGGMGEVYRAVHTYLDAPRVIKIIRASIAGNDASDRFLREARLATKVQHPNVATLHDFAALPDGSHYMVWEYIEGQNLANVLRDRGTLPPPEEVDITRQALDGLEAIHRAGIVHRDISPENLMITRADGAARPAVKIIDLGVAKMDEPDQNLTKTGIFIGKLRYASPEHLGFLREGTRIDGRADLYSLAIVLYEMLTGRPPFEATSPHQYLMHHSTAAEAPPPDLTRVPLPLRPVLARALERDREKRFPTARAFAEALNVPLTELRATDADVTMRVPPEAPTIRTPLPQPRTVIDPSPAPPPMPRRRSIAILAPILLIAVIAVMWAMRPRNDVPPEPAKSASTTQAAAIPPQSATTTTAAPSQTSIDVTTATATPLLQPATTTTATEPKAAPATPTHEAPPPVPQPAIQPAPPPQHAEPAVPVPAPGPAGAMYTEGGDGDANGAAVEKARTALSGVTHVSVVNGGDPVLAEQLIKSLTGSGLEVGPGADVTIQFSGTLEHIGRGKKRRTAHATVIRHGHAVFRYELPAEEYRVGDNPAEAFARVFRDAMGK